MDIIRRLATGQARGERQLSLVNELLSFRAVYFTYVDIPGPPGSQTVVYGLTKLPFSSYRNLRTRLISVGFVFEVDRDYGSVTMKFPEANL